MSKNNVLFWFILLITALLISGSKPLSLHNSTNFQSLQYHIRASSSLEINGTTNVNTFCCASKERFTKGTLKYMMDPGQALLHFKQSILPVTISQLDCGGKAINRDLHKTLQSEAYPCITIELLRADNTECVSLKDCDRWVSFLAITNITIGGLTRRIDIPVQINKKDEHLFQVKGGTSVLLRDFELEPPTAMMGLIKVKDQIDIHFDLLIELL